jgi:hypothetical protein
VLKSPRCGTSNQLRRGTTSVFNKISWLRPGSRVGLLSVCLALGLTGVAHGLDDPDSVSSLAGIYSSAHTVKVNGLKESTFGYIEIDSDGRITAYEQKDEGPDSIGSGCYMLASGTATNAGLQSRTLTLGTTLQGAAAYVTQAGDSDTFAILAAPAASGNRVWYFHNGRNNTTLTINGTNNVVSADYRASYSISFPALAHPTHDELLDKLCPGQ